MPPKKKRPLVWLPLVYRPLIGVRAGARPHGQLAGRSLPGAHGSTGGKKQDGRTSKQLHQAPRKAPAWRLSRMHGLARPSQAS